MENEKKLTQELTENFTDAATDQNDKNLESMVNSAELNNERENKTISSNDMKTRVDEDKISDVVSEIQDVFSKNDIEMDTYEIKDRFKELTDTFKVPENEAKRCIINHLIKKYNLDKNLYFSSKNSIILKKIKDIYEAVQRQKEREISKRTMWANLDVRIVSLWDKNHETISQSGIAGDESGAIRFTIWKSSKLPMIEKDECYSFKNVVVREWNGQCNIELNRVSSIQKIDKSIQVPEDAVDEIVQRKESTLTKIADVTDGLWTDIKIKVLKIWDNTHESIKQTGFAGDETGFIKFTLWNTSDAAEMEEKKCYLIKNSVIKEWNGKLSVEINKTTTVEEIDEEIQIDFEKVSLSGVAVDVQSGSGLIKRCPSCNKVISRGFCNDHGKVKGLYDLRIKAVIDDGNQTYDVIVNRDLTEEISGMKLKEAVEYAAETLDTEFVSDNLKASFIGKYYKIEGTKTDKYVIADSIEACRLIESNEKETLEFVIRNDIEIQTDTEVI